MAFYSTTDYNNEETSQCSINDSDSSSVSTNHKNEKKMKDQLKTQDPGYFKIYRKFGNSKKRTKLELYKTPISGNSYIRNAVTGFSENAKIGTNASNLHFSVALCTGELGNEPVHLYFDSPEQYEKVFDQTVSQTTKDEWNHRDRKSVV